LSKHAALLWNCIGRPFVLCVLTTPPPSSVAKMSGNDATSEVYAKHLLLERLGYPLWYPDLPLDKNLPQGYRDDGVSIGDVGKITGDGAFEFKFNICADAGDPTNARGVPDHFERWAIVPEDRFYVPAMFPPETIIKRGSIIAKSQGMIEPSYDFLLKFICIY
jgi:hypothetical protein